MISQKLFFSRNGGTPSSLAGLFQGKSHLEMDENWGYPHFRKPPYMDCLWLSSFYGLSMESHRHCWSWRTPSSVAAARGSLAPYAQPSSRMQVRLRPVAGSSRSSSISLRQYIPTYIDSENSSESYRELSKLAFIYPICSMYGIFAYIYPKHGPNVGKYSIHGASGYEYVWIVYGL